MEFVGPLLGGILIGLAAALFLFLNGRILGISGIVGGSLVPRAGDASWRFAFIGGLLGGGFVMWAIEPAWFSMGIVRSPWALVAAGLLVGFGTRMGSGCTSGHGVCGVARMSPRSLVATATFMVAGIATVFVVSRVFGGVL